MTTGIIFDMDGTLWDSAENVARSWTEVLKNHPNPDCQSVSEQDVKSVMGLTMTDIADRFFPSLPEDEKMTIMNACMDYENEYLAQHGGILYPALAETFQKLMDMGYPLYIVSNCQSGYIEAFLTYFHFEKYFKDISCFGDTQQPKGITMKMLADKNQLDDFYYVGDIQGDYDATMIAGGKFIHAKYGFGTVDANVPALKQFSDLPELMLTLQ